MKLLPVFLFLSIALLPPAVRAEKASTAYPVVYAGGTLPLNQSRVRASIGKNEVIFMQHGYRIAVPVKNITDISCGTEVHRRLGASVLDVVPLMHLGETETHYVGVAWSGSNGGAARTQVLLKLSRGEYREFLAALEQLTGLKAVDTNQVPTVVHYNL